MATDLHNTNEVVEKVNRAYTPTYVPLFSRIFSKSVAYPATIGKVQLKETQVIGDATVQQVNAQDTEFKHAKAGDTSKTFNNYIEGVKFIASGFQEQPQLQGIANQILDQNLMKFDSDVFYGAPLKDGRLSNNGLYGSKDENQVKLASQAMGANPTVDAWKEYLDAALREAGKELGTAPKIIVLMGQAASKIGKFVPNTAVSFLKALQDSYTADQQLTWLTAPENLNSPDGIMIVTPSALTFRYVMLPRVYKQGYNDENEYTWMTILSGSSMVDIERRGGIVIKPATFTA